MLGAIVCCSIIRLENTGECQAAIGNETNELKEVLVDIGASLWTKVV